MMFNHLLQTPAQVFGTAAAKLTAGTALSTPILLGADLLPHDYVIIAVMLGVLVWLGGLVGAVVGIIAWLNNQIKSKVQEANEQQTKIVDLRLDLIRQDISVLKGLLTPRRNPLGRATDHQDPEHE